MGISLITLLCIAFAGSVFAQKDSPLDGQVYPVESTEELSKEELMKHLICRYNGDADEDIIDFRPSAEWIAGNLSRAMNKDTTEIVDGLTVADLLEFNWKSPAKCRRDFLYKREYACRRTEPLKYVEWYCRQTLRKLALYCARELLQVLEPGPVKDRAAKHGIPYDSESAKFWKQLGNLNSNHAFNVKLKYFIRGMVEDADVSMWQLVKGSKTEVFSLIQDGVLSREQLLDRIKNNDNDWVGPKSVAVHLGMTQDKDHTEVVGGLSVADLLKLNLIAKENCQPLELQRRQSICPKASALKFVEEYCDYCVRTLAQFCVRKMPLSFDPFWRGLARVVDKEDYYVQVKKYLQDAMSSGASQ